MISVREQPEPASFGVNVRTPGALFLRRVPRPSRSQWKSERHWKKALDELYRAYDGLCAYSAHWIPRDVTRETVDHFIPKKEAPELAYEWSNYRLASEKMNQYKDDSLDVMDPFAIRNDWFTLEFPSFLVKPNRALPDYMRDAIQKSIECLKLNDDDKCVEQRMKWTLHYCNDEVTMAFLERRYPFIASEIKRQGLQERIKTMLRRRRP